MKKHLQRLFLTALVLLLGGVGSAWAAGHTRTLTENLEVAGYKVKQLYDFQNNNPEVLPTSGDLRYREYANGGYWGLQNFGSGTRSATATIPVAENDILILQHYSADVIATINRGTLNETLTSSTGYQVYNITTTAEDITFTIARYGGIVAALVMEKDASAATADYTINYLLDGSNVKTTTGNAAVGAGIPVGSSFFIDDVKYFVKDGEATSLTITSGTNELNVNVRLAGTYAYTVTGAYGTQSRQLANGSVYEGEAATVAYPKYILDGTTLFAIAPNGSGDYYRKTFTPDADGYNVALSYEDTPVGNVVFYTEAEDIEGASKGTNTARASMGQMGHTGGADTYIGVTNLQPGKYVIYTLAHNGNSASRTANFKVGETVVFTTTIGNGNNITANSDEFIDI